MSEDGTEQQLKKRFYNHYKIFNNIQFGKRERRWYLSKHVSSDGSRGWRNLQALG
jgi:hypothetical protein